VRKKEKERLEFGLTPRRRDSFLVTGKKVGGRTSGRRGKQTVRKWGSGTEGKKRYGWGEKGEKKREVRKEKNINQGIYLKM